jgi:glycosyltransferase involved in cell wall biosynthesis
MLEGKLKQDRIEYRTLKSNNKYFPVLTAKTLANLITQNHIDVLHISWGKDLNLASLGKYIAGKQVKLVYSRHMEITRSKKDLFHRWFYNQVDKILAVSRMVEENALMFLPLSRQNIELLYLGVAAPNTAIAECDSLFEHYPIQKRTMNIALFGRIEKGKAQHIMLSALKLLVDKKYDVSLTLVGHVMDEGYYYKLNQLVKSYELTDYVVFTGMIQGVINKMPCFDVVVLTTPKETFGLVLVEAMRGGVAVVGTNAGGVVDIIDDGINGLLFEPDDPGSLYEALSKLYDKPDLRARIAIEGKKKADDIFSENHHFQQLLNSFTTVCTQNNTV